MMPNPKRTYFIRAMHEWLSDNGFTPYLMVDINTPNLLAPIEYAQDGRLVLAISYQATNNLLIDNDGISFAARFGGVSKDVWIPMQAVMGIYAKEDNTHALFFDPNEYKNHQTPTNNNVPETPKPNHLKFV